MSDKLKLAVIGAGRWGPNLIRNFYENPRCSLSAICDLDEERLKALAERYPGVAVQSNWQAIATDPNLDAVVICSPTVTHYNVAKLALESGKHIFVEKPLTHSLSEAITLDRIAKKNGLKIMVGHVFLFNAGIQATKALLDKKALGSLYYAYATRTNLGPIRGDVSVLWDLAAHDISIFHYLLGRSPQTLSATGSSFINPPLEDVAFANMRYSGGFMANIHVSWLDPKKVRQIIIVGSEKMLVFDDMDAERPVKVFDKGVGPDLSETMINDTLHMFRKSILEGEVSCPAITPTEPLRRECDAFVQWVLDDEPQPSSSKLGIEVVRTLSLMESSIAQKGIELKYDSVTDKESDDRTYSHSHSTIGIHIG